MRMKNHAHPARLAYRMRTIFKENCARLHTHTHTRRIESTGRRWARSDKRENNTGLFYTDFRNTKRACCCSTGTASVQLRGERHEECCVAFFIVPLLTMPAFAGSSNVGDKRIVVAEGAEVGIGGAGVGVGERHRYRNRTGLYMSERGHHYPVTITTTVRMM